MQLCPTNYQDGVANSEKAHYYVAKALFYMSMQDSVTNI